MIENCGFKVLKQIVGKKLNNIFKQLDMFIINFGEEIEYTFHTYCVMRIVKGSEILLTHNDEYYLPNKKQMTKKQYKRDTLHEKSLLHANIAKVKQLLEGAVVEEVKITETADVFIKFSNGVIIENIIDVISQGEEYYSFFKYDKSSPHYIVGYDDKLCIEEFHFKR